MKRMLHYRERHSGWYIFRSVYWAVYVFVIGYLFIAESVQNLPVGFMAGSALVILSVAIVLYGFASALHLKLMKKYG